VKKKGSPLAAVTNDTLTAGSDEAGAALDAGALAVGALETAAAEVGAAAALLGAGAAADAALVDAAGAEVGAAVFDELLQAVKASAPTIMGTTVVRFMMLPLS
jgi:hypothetical protein